MESNLEKRLILINPPAGNYVIRYILAALFARHIPFPLLTLAALTPRDYKIKFFNQPPFYLKKELLKGALVGITCMTPNARPAYELAVSFRKAGAYVVMGGPHVTALPQEALQYSDSVVTGEAESVWKEVIKDFENRALKKIYTGEPLEDFFSPAYDYFLNLDLRILRWISMPVSRGCKYNCDFCARLPGPVRYMKIEQIIQIIKRMKQYRTVSFIPDFLPMVVNFPDSNIFSNPAYAKRLFKELIPLKIKWVSQSSIDIAFDEEALGLAKQSGCKGLFVGFETIQPEQFEKTSVNSITSTKDYIKSIRKIKSYGMKVVGSFIIGFDQYEHIHYFKLLCFLISTVVKCRLYWIPLGILTPFPGSKLFDRLKQEGRITTYDWNKYDILFHVVFRPKMAVFPLLLWVHCIRIITLFCSNVGITIFLSSIVSSYLSYRIRLFLLISHGV